MSTTTVNLPALIEEVFRLDPGQVSPAHDLYEDLAFDSLDMVELVMVCEQRFGIEISDDDADVTTVQALAEVIERRLA